MPTGIGTPSADSLLGIVIFVVVIALVVGIIGAMSDDAPNKRRRY